MTSIAVDRSRLLPCNRKVRHLQGICLRNLNLDPAIGRTRGTTIDDEALPYALKSPVNFLDEGERRQLTHTRSFENLKPVQEQPAADQSLDTDARSPVVSPRRPKKLRRRSTLEWTNTTPAERHDSLEQAVSRRSADVFFSLHVRENDEPVYVSEVAERAMNPDFRALDLRASSSSISRRNELVVKVWARSGQSWELLVHAFISLPSLSYIGKSLEEVRYPLPDNSLLFGLTDGFYMSVAESQSKEGNTDIKLNGHVTAHAEPTSSYDALMRLATLDERIQDAIATRGRLTADINKLITQDKASYFATSNATQCKNHASRVEKAVNKEQRSVKSARSRLDELRKDLETRRQTMARDREAVRKSSQELKSNESKLDGSRKALTTIQDVMTAQKRHICSKLAEIYPIEPMPKRTLAFTIRDLHIPNADFTNAQEERVSAALGYVAHLVLMLSLYLSVALPYPILPSSSTSTIRDPISIMSGSRIFPLYMPHAILYRFEYGVFLMNKDIELLANKIGLKLIDIRQTLPNLKYILFVATTGQGGVPARQSCGAAKGLLRGAVEKETPDSSRRSSFDGDGPGQSALREQLPAGTMARNESVVKD